MQIVRTIIWVLLLVALLLFSWYNWTSIEVMIWPGSEQSQALYWVTKLPAIIIISFLIGFLPMWLYHRGSKWRANRKIASLENAARTAAATPVATQVSNPDTTVDAEPDLRADPNTPLRPADPVSQPSAADTLTTSEEVSADRHAKGTDETAGTDTPDTKERGNLL